MNTRIRAVVIAALTTCSIALGGAATAQANVLSLLPGSCSGEVTSQPFAPWGDNASYTLAPGGDFESSALSWLHTGAAATVDGNEDFHVGGAGDSSALALPAGSSATSPAMCASIYKPTARFFARNTGSASSRLNVDVLYPGLLGNVQVARAGSIGASARWQPTGIQQLTLTNVLATLSLSRTAIALRFTPADSGGNWQIDDVYVDPFQRR